MTTALRRAEAIQRYVEGHYLPGRGDSDAWLVVADAWAEADEPARAFLANLFARGWTMRAREMLDQLARQFVGSESRDPRLFFVSDRQGVIGIFLSEQEALAFARPRDLYVEGPPGEILPSSWS